MPRAVDVNAWSPPACKCHKGVRIRTYGDRKADRRGTGQDRRRAMVNRPSLTRWEDIGIASFPESSAPLTFRQQG